MLSCHLCLLVSCDDLVFWILSFDCTFCLIAWYLYFLLLNIDISSLCLHLICGSSCYFNICQLVTFIRQLRKQQRIRLHVCLFVSFLLTAIITSMWDFLIYYDRIQKSSNPEMSRMSQNSVSIAIITFCN